MHHMPIWTGGMKRCCLETLRNVRTMHVEGDVIPCARCGVALRVRNSAWELAKDILPYQPVSNTRLDGAV
jgi:hypothetical protein